MLKSVFDTKAWADMAAANGLLRVSVTYTGPGADGWPGPCASVAGSFGGDELCKMVEAGITRDAVEALFAQVVTQSTGRNPLDEAPEPVRQEPPAPPSKEMIELLGKMNEKEENAALAEERLVFDLERWQDDNRGCLQEVVNRVDAVRSLSPGADYTCRKWSRENPTTRRIEVVVDLKIYAAKQKKREEMSVESLFRS